MTSTAPLKPGTRVTYTYATGSRVYGVVIRTTKTMLPLPGDGRWVPVQLTDIRGSYTVLCHLDQVEAA